MKFIYFILLFSIPLLTACAETEMAEVQENKELEEVQENKELEEVHNIVQDKKVKENQDPKSNEQRGDGELKEETETVKVNEPKYKLNENNWSLEPINKANKKVVLLTIDDAPDKNALEMAQTLSNLGVKAIFFVNGHFIDSPEEEILLKNIHELGFPIGNHTYSHSNLKNLTKEKQYEEIVGLNDRIEEIIGYRPKFFRAPFGSNTEYSKRIAGDEKMLVMNWTYGYDWEKEYQTKEAITDIMVNSPYLIEGANLLMHDRKWTNEALEDIVKGLQGKGFEMLDPSLIKQVN